MRATSDRFNVPGILLSTVMRRQDLGPSVCTRAMYRWVNRTEGEADHQWRTQDFFSGGVQQIQLMTEDREKGDLGAVAS